MEDLIEINGCVLSPEDDRDFELSGMVSNEISLPEYAPAPFNDLTPINQFAQDESKYACVACSLSGLKQQMSRMQKVSEQYDFIELYQACKDIDGIPNVNGTYLRVALKIAKDRGIRTTSGIFRKIREYVKINVDDPAELATAVYLYHGVYAAYTLSNNGWRGTTVREPKDGEATAGHAIFINGFTKDKWIARDSMPSYHNNANNFEIPMSYMPKEAWVITLDDIVIPATLRGWVAKDYIKDGKTTARLNLRETPGGKVLNVLPFGTLVYIESEVFAEGRTWVLVDIM